MHSERGSEDVHLIPHSGGIALITSVCLLCEHVHGSLGFVFMNKF